MTISTLADVRAAQPGRAFLFSKQASQYSNAFPGGMSAWMVGGTPGAASTPPSGAGGVPTNATAGAIPIVNAGTGKTLYVSKFRAVQIASPAASGADQNIAPETYVWLLDRLVHTSGLSGTVTTAQTVNSAAITRGDLNGVGAELFIEGYTQLGSLATTVSISYTNSAGTSGRTASGTLIAFFGPSGQGQFTFASIPLQAGDVGVKSVQSVTLAGSTGTAGNFGITIARRICGARAVRNVQQTQDHFGVGLAKIEPNAALMLALSNGGGDSDTATTHPFSVTGELMTIEG